MNDHQVARVVLLMSENSSRPLEMAILQPRHPQTGLLEEAEQMNDHQVTWVVLPMPGNSFKDSKPGFDTDFAPKYDVIDADTLKSSQTSPKIVPEGNENLKTSSGSEAIQQVVQINNMGSVITQIMPNLLEVVSPCLGKAQKVIEDGPLRKIVISDISLVL